MAESVAHHSALAEMSRYWAKQQPDATAITLAGGPSVTFGQLDRRANQVANCGVLGRGDRIAYLGHDPTVWAELLVGANKAGAVGVPLNWRLSRAELREVIEDAAPRWIVADNELLPLLDRASQPQASTVVIGIEGREVERYPMWRDRQADSDPGHSPESGDIAFLIYTSGTSGTPKGVQLSNHNVATNLATQLPWTVGPGSVVSVPAPLFHISGTGWLFHCLGFGARAVFSDDANPGRILGFLESTQATHALMVPAVLQQVIRHPDAADFDLSSLRTLIYGGSPISQVLIEETQQILRCDLVQCYGMTETCGLITYLGPEEHRRLGPHIASAGRPAPGVEVEIHDPATAEPLPNGVTGEVWTRSALVSPGYRNRPEENAAAHHSDAWFRTGDAGHFDDDGYLYLTDRVHDLIITGGENVYPVEVENVLTTHPGVAECAVVGAPDERWGETVTAAVVTRPGFILESAELIDYCRERLAHYKCPTSVTFMADLPRTASGKILRRELRKARSLIAGETSTVGGAPKDARLDTRPQQHKRSPKT